MAKNGSHAARTTGSSGDTGRLDDPRHTSDLTGDRHQGRLDGHHEGHPGLVDRDRDDAPDGRDRRHGLDGQVHVTTPAPRADQVRWGPLWAGLTIIVPVFLLGELLFLAVGVLDTGDSVSGGTAGVVTGLIALVAFFVGGLVAGATAMWRGASTGLLHGILVWALGITAILVLTIIGGGALLGSAGNIASQLVDPATTIGAATGAAGQAPDVSAAEAADAGRSAASWGLLGLGVTILASALGGLVGAKVWPRTKDVTTDVQAPATSR